MQGPLAAVVLLLELTHHADSLMVAVLLAIVEATVLARVFGAPSIYSARTSAPAQRAQPDIAARGEGSAGAQPAGARDMDAPSDVVPDSLAHNLER
jgi:hypothetical protein